MVADPRGHLGILMSQTLWNILSALLDVKWLSTREVIFINWRSIYFIINYGTIICILNRRLSTNVRSILDCRLTAPNLSSFPGAAIIAIRDIDNGWRVSPSSWVSTWSRIKWLLWSWAIHNIWGLTVVVQIRLLQSSLSPLMWLLATISPVLWTFFALFLIRKEPSISLGHQSHLSSNYLIKWILEVIW